MHDSMIPPLSTLKIQELSEVTPPLDPHQGSSPGNPSPVGGSKIASLLG